MVFLTTVTWLGGGGFSAMGLGEEGALKLLGYPVVREASLADHERRSKLDVVFQTIISPFTHRLKVLELRKRQTAPHLKRLANWLPTFARKGVRQPDDRMSKPAESWGGVGQLADQVLQERIRPERTDVCL
jgi:hypothetical protein